MLISKENIIARLINNLEEEFENEDFSNEDDENELKDNNVSSKAYFLLRKLKWAGWIELEMQRDSFEEYIILPDYSIKFINLLYSIIEEKQVEYNSYVFATYSSLKLASMQKRETYNAIITSYNNTIQLINELKSLYNSLGRFHRKMINKDNINDIINEHFFEYKEYSDEVIFPRFTRDSVPRYKAPIREMLNDILADEEQLKNAIDVASKNDKIHSFGIVDIGKIQKENKMEINEESLATEILTENKFAKIYIYYLLGRVIKCETIENLRKNKIAITPDCMLYQGYVLRKINPNFYKYPIIGKNALEKQKQVKEKELVELTEKILNEENIIKVMKNIKQMINFSNNDIANLNDNIEESKKKEGYLLQKQEIQKEIDGMDMFWLNKITEQILQKEDLKYEKEQLIKKNSTKIGELETDIKTKEFEKAPNIKEQIEIKERQINENYTEQWQQTIGEEKYGIQSLKKTAEKIQEIFLHNIKSTTNKKEQTKLELVDKRSSYNTQYQLSFNIYDSSNKEFTEELRKLKEIALPEYLDKIDDSRKKAYEQFRIEFLDKLKSNIDEVKSQIKELNNALNEHRFGTDSYSFRVTPKQEYKRFYDMLQDELLLGDWGIGQEQFNQKYAQEIKELFDKVTTTELNVNLVSDEEYERNIREYTDYRTYLNFDLIVKDKMGNEQRLSKTLLKKSGGETQTPFYISILASFAQVYRIRKDDNTIRLIIFDEAFSKMDSERIEESIKLLRKIGFQAIFAAPPEKLQDIQKLVDSTLLIINLEEHEIIVKKYANREKW